MLFVVNSLENLCPGQFVRESIGAIPQDSCDWVLAILDVDRPKQRQFELPDGPVFFLGKRFHFDLGAAAHLAQLIRQHKIDIVHAWSGRANRISQIANSLERRKLIWTKTDFQNSDARSFQLGKTKQVSKIVTTHAEIARRLMQAGFGEQEIATIPMGAPLPVFQPCAGSKVRSSSIRDSLDIPEEIFLVGAHASMVPRNRWKDLLWAVDLVQSVRDDFQFLAFGDGPQRWRLEKYAQQVDAAGKTHFLGSDPAFLNWLPELDLFWHGYQHDPAPFPVVAALRSGCPVLAPEDPELAAMVGAGGKLFELGHRDQIARITNSLFDDRQQLEHLGQQAKSIEHLADIRETVTRLLDVYDDLL